MKTLTSLHRIRRVGVLATLLAFCQVPIQMGLAQGTAFTYQGRLTDGGNPADGIYDLQFAVFDAANGGTQQGNTVAVNSLTVSNGYFAATIDPGGNVFTGASRWLNVAVRPTGGGAFTSLVPRQAIQSAPYAIRAAGAVSATTAQTVSGPVAASQLTGSISPANLPPNLGTALAPGAVVMSDDPANTALTEQGYVALPNAQMTLAAENWARKNDPVKPPEFITRADWETSVNTGTEFIVFRAGAGARINSVLRFNLATSQWTKGSNPPTGNLDDPPLGGAVNSTAVWTGTQVLIWGGGDNGGNSSNPTKVYAYTPGIDQWTVTDGSGAVPVGRRSHTAVWTGSRMLVWGGERIFSSNNVPYFEDVGTGGSFDPVTGIWTSISTVGSPGKRRSHVAVWTGTRMIVHGGLVDNRGGWAVNQTPDSPTNVFNNGFSYSLALDTWSPILSDNSAPRLTHARAVWAGSEMFVYGGGSYQYDNFSLSYRLLPELGAYSYRPSLNLWTSRGVPDSVADPLRGRLLCGLVFTGTEVLAWGGSGYNPDAFSLVARNDGVAYDLAGNSWRRLPAAPAEMPPVFNPCATWSTNRMVLFGGRLVAPQYTSTNAASFAPGANSWTLLPNYYGAPPLIQNAPSSVWTGTEFILWGGPVGGPLSSRGQRYNPANDTWIEMTTVNAPAPRQGHSAVWTGSRMIVWGGDNGYGVYANGGVYNPNTDAWESYTSLNNPPIDPVTGIAFKRTGHKAVWTAHGMIIVGGSDGDNSGNQIYNPSFARYIFPNDDWDLASGSSHLGRRRHNLATDGNRVVFLWGGYGQVDSDPVGDPVTIDAATLVATPRDTADQHTPAADPSIVWSGKEFIVWGGTYTDGSPLEGGSRFDPATEIWTPIYVSSTPHAGHTAAWSGTEMLLWGGTTNAFGTRYNPRNNAWAQMVVGPVTRPKALSAWTGNDLLLYLPALPNQGAVPELWRYTPPVRTYFYLKQ